MSACSIIFYLALFVVVVWRFECSRNKSDHQHDLENLTKQSKKYKKRSEADNRYFAAELDDNFDDFIAAYEQQHGASTAIGWFPAWQKRMLRYLSGDFTATKRGTPEGYHGSASDYYKNPHQYDDGNW